MCYQIVSLTNSDAHSGHEHLELSLLSLLVLILPSAHTACPCGSVPPYATANTPVLKYPPAIRSGRCSGSSCFRLKEQWSKGRPITMEVRHFQAYFQHLSTSPLDKHVKWLNIRMFLQDVCVKTHCGAFLSQSKLKSITCCSNLMVSRAELIPHFTGMIH